MTPRVDRIPLFARWRTRLPAFPEGFRFLIVGALAYLVSQLCLLLLYDLLPLLPDKGRPISLPFLTHPDGRLLVASIAAVEAAIVFKFWAHELWTFRGRRVEGRIAYRFLAFNASCFVSAVITVATVNVVTLAFAVSPYVSNTLGALGGVLVNWAFSAYLIWRHAPAGGALGERRSA